MNILNLLSKKKNIVGIEINNEAIRIAYFRPQDKWTKEKDISSYQLILKEEKLPNNVVSDGLIVDKAPLSTVLKKIWDNENLNKYYAVVSIEEDKIYSQILSFPKDIDETKIKEAVSLAIDFQMPIKKEEVYIGWELDKSSKTANKVLISAIPKKVVDSYTKVLDSAGINVLALESNISSIIRSIKLNPEENLLITKENNASVTFFYIRKNALQFSRTIPKLYINSGNSIEKEQLQIKNSLESEAKEPIKEINISEAGIVDQYSKHIDKTNERDTSKWLASIGAFARGQIPEGEDNQISLLPIGTAEAFAYQKIKIFIALIRNIIIGVSLFFLFTYIASYLFIFSISQKMNKNKVLVSPISTDITKKESLIKETNSLTLVSQSIIQSTPHWSVLIDELSQRTIDGITISNLRIQSINETISIVGISASREALNKYKISLQGSKYLTGVELPITNLEQKGDIPFSISFKIKDPSMLYNK